MPVEGVPLTAADGLLSLEEQQRAIDIFAGLGVRKVRFTGGEPTLNKQLPTLVAHASHAMRGAGSVARCATHVARRNAACCPSRVALRVRLPRAAQPGDVHGASERRDTIPH
jgi:molybdenum cofactor biosynthesis enzyme MoaA